jgi:hypothetical protein
LIKGYIFKDEGWQLGFLSSIGAEGEALFTTYGIYSTHEEALKALIEKQIQES